MVSDKLIVEIAEKLGMATEQIFDIFSESIKGIALFNIYMLALFIIGGCIIFFVIYKIYKRDNPGSTDGEDIANIVICGIVVCAFYGMLLIICADVIKPYLFPEYFAIKEMLETLKINS